MYVKTLIFLRGSNARDNQLSNGSFPNINKNTLGS